MTSKFEFDLNLLDKCKFDYMNPFDLDDPIIDFGTSLHQHKKFFLTLAYKEWLLYEYQGESSVAVAYRYILDNIKNGKYQDYLKGFSQNQYDALYEYLETTIKEEIKHSKYWGLLGEKIYQDKFNLIDLNDPIFVKNVHNFVDEYGLIPSLTCFFMGETVTLAACSMLYKHSTNQIKKRFLKIFLTEEVKHINGFSNLMKFMVVNADRNEIEHAKSLYPDFLGQNFNYFGLNQVFQAIDLKLPGHQPKDEIQNSLIQSIINNNWQQQFNNFVLKRNFNFYKNFDPSINEQNFCNHMNHKLLSSLYWL
jgi:hypothetical protein